MIGNPNAPIDGSHTTPSVPPSPLTTPGILRPKIDPYYLIMNVSNTQVRFPYLTTIPQNLLGHLRVEVEEYIPVENPYRWQGTMAPWDYDEISKAFANSQILTILFVDNTRIPSMFFGFSAGGLPITPINGSGANASYPNTVPEARNLKVTKLALLSRRDDLLEGGKKIIQRKWRPYSVALTHSHLLFSRDLSWTTSNSKTANAMVFKADEAIPVKEAFAVLDKSYIAVRFFYPVFYPILRRCCSTRTHSGLLWPTGAISSFKQLMRRK